MKALRDAAAAQPEIKDAWTDSLQNPITLLNSVFGRLSYSNQPIKVCDCVRNYVLLFHSKLPHCVFNLRVGAPLCEHTLWKAKVELILLLL